MGAASDLAGPVATSIRPATRAGASASAGTGAHGCSRPAFHRALLSSVRAWTPGVSSSSSSWTGSRTARGERSAAEVCRGMLVAYLRTKPNTNPPAWAALAPEPAHPTPTLFSMGREDGAGGVCSGTEYGAESHRTVVASALG